MPVIAKKHILFLNIVVEDMIIGPWGHRLGSTLRERLRSLGPVGQLKMTDNVYPERTCNTPGVYISFDNEYGLERSISLSIIVTKF